MISILLVVPDSMVNVKDALGRWRKKVGEASKKAEDLAENTWQHCEFLLSFFISLSFCYFCLDMLAALLFVA